MLWSVKTGLCFTNSGQAVAHHIVWPIVGESRKDAVNQFLRIFPGRSWRWLQHHYHARTIRVSVREMADKEEHGDTANILADLLDDSDQPKAAGILRRFAKYGKVTHIIDDHEQET